MESTTRNQSNEIYSQSIGSETLKNNIKTYLVVPLSAGLGGFAAIFSLIIITKLMSYLFGINPTLHLSLNDVIYSLVGFILGAGTKFLEFFGKEE